MTNNRAQVLLLGMPCWTDFLLAWKFSIQESRLDNLGWRLWYCQQKMICPRENKFQLIEEEEEEYTSDEEDFEQDLLFEKSYQTSTTPISLLTEMLQPPTLKRHQAKSKLWKDITSVTVAKDEVIQSL